MGLSPLSRISVWTLNDSSEGASWVKFCQSICILSSWRILLAHRPKKFLIVPCHLNVLILTRLGPALRGGCDLTHDLGPHLSGLTTPFDVSRRKAVRVRQLTYPAQFRIRDGIPAEFKKAKSFIATLFWGQAVRVATEAGNSAHSSSLTADGPLQSSVGAGKPIEASRRPA